MKNIGLGPKDTPLVSTTYSQGSSSFEGLALPMFDSLYNLARWLAHNQTDAEDIVQETYLKAWRSFASFQPGTNFRAWMFRILRNTLITSRSGLKVTITEPIDLEKGGAEFAVENATPETILFERADSDLVRSALQDLPIQHREIVLLCDVEGLSYREIAESLSIPLGTVMSRLSRARNALRNDIRRKVGGEKALTMPA